ncbi:ABC transporter substrate-binding protein [Herbaspirillum sp. meg3]|uniref:extracellular solute-binding protein n=1 Tax=Herbaspirillum sp. meg3 TaxID=2025949 RepID=UPI000B999886|nr:extracellular solute-binding protein [Herbaspirillum sp. meg3]ASU41297.1 ABC transporter substrate-binding protein [Herbaspirillum sp. meg3]
MFKFLVSVLLVGILAQSSSAFAAYAMALGYTPKYPPGFTHFDYVNPDAPKQGQITFPALGSFDKLNPFTLKGSVVSGMGQGGNGFVFTQFSLIFESLMTQSEDEPFSAYGLLAEDMDLAPDQLSVTFRLNPAARFSNGDPVTAEDVKYSFRTLTGKSTSPVFRSYWADVKNVVVVNRLTVRFEFSKKNSELHMIIGQLPVFSPKWGQGKPFDKVALEQPIGSGPYTVEKFDFGKYVTYKRNPAYWATNLPSRRGLFNFDRVSFRYYKDDFTRLEAFKAGEFDVNIENNVRNWVRGYNGKRFSSGELVKHEFPRSNVTGLQGYVFNLRRPIFQDVRVRKAIGLALDFEWLNRQLYYGRLKRSDSYFTNSELAAKGLPDAEELKILMPLKDKLRPEVFGPAPVPPSTAAPGSLRENLKKARDLLAQAGWTYRDGALRNAQGNIFSFDFMIVQQSSERVIAPFARNLEKLGIRMNYRMIDAALAQKRINDFDFDMVTQIKGGSSSPGNELYDDFGSHSAGESGSENYGGIADPAIDALIDRVVKSSSRTDLINASRALDRVLLHGFYCVPNYYIEKNFVAHRNTLGYPPVPPHQYAPQVWALTMWWTK